MNPNTLIVRHFIDAPLRGAKRLGLGSEELLIKAGLPKRALDNPQHSLTHHEYARLMSRLWQLGNDEFMGLAPVASPYGCFAMMCKAVLSCVNLEHALHRASHFYQLFECAPRLEVIRQEHYAKLIIHHDQEYDSDHFLTESLLLIWHRLSSWLVGQGIALYEVGCNYSAPEHAAYYAQLFACPVRFEQPHTYLLIPSSSLNLSLTQSSASLNVFLKHSPADLLARPIPHHSISGQVRRFLRQQPLAQLPSLNQTAAALGFSSASLRRHLAQELSSFQLLKDELKLNEARHLLAQPEIELKTIAERLGFTEVSTFHRAFRKWQGQTPGQYRTANLKSLS